MGNTIQVRLKEDKPVLITETQVAELKEYISMADHSMAALAKSMDAMRDACEMLLRQLDNESQLHDATTCADSKKDKGQQLARHLLEMINASVSDNKYVVMKSISKLFNFVWGEGKSSIDIAEDSSFEFLVDKYMHHRDSVGMEDVVSYTDLRIRALQRDIKMLQDKYTASEQELKVLNMREVQYRKEIKILENKNKPQKENTEDVTEKQNYEIKDCNDTKISDDKREITVLKKEITSLKQENEQFRNDLIVAKGVTEACLHRKEQKINELEQELQNLKIDNSPKMPPTVGDVTSTGDLKSHPEETSMSDEKNRLNQELTTLKKCKVLLVDKETSMEDFEGQTKENDIRKETKNLNEEIAINAALKNDKETSMEDFEEGLINETNMKEEIDRLNQEISALKTNKVLHGFEYNDWTCVTPNYYEKEIKNYIYQSLESELASCNINWNIPPWRPSKNFGFPTDKVIIVPINMLPYKKLQDMMKRAFEKIKAGPNIVVLVYYNADMPQVCDEVNKPVGEEFDSLGGIFKFGHSIRKHPNTEMNDKNFKGLLQFLKSKCSEGRYLSR